jgi:amino acid transporter
MESQTMKPRHRLKKLIRGWLPEEPKTPSRGLYQPMFKGWTGSLLTGIGAALIVLGLSFCFSSSFYVDGYLPAAAVLDVIGHYLEGIAIGCAFLASGVILVVFGIKKSQNNYFTPQIRASENLIEGWLPKEPQAPNRQLITIRKPPKTSTQVWIVIFIMGCVSGLLGAFSASFDLFSRLGIYVWLILICIVLSIVAAAIFVRKKVSEERRRMSREVG